MTNSLKINVSKEEFMKKQSKEQNWMLFEAICRIDQAGCSWARKNKKFLSAKQIAASFLGGASIVAAKMVFWK